MVRTSKSLRFKETEKDTADLVNLSASQSVSGQCWSDEESDGDIDCENIIYGAQVSI